MPRLVRMYLFNIAIGFGLAVLFTAALLWLNVANLGHLVATARGGWLAVVLLVMFNTIVFAGVQFGIAVMRMAEPETPPGGGKRQSLHPAPQPAMATARAEKPQRG
ncbi:MAG: hypothetical protein Q4G36_12640 [Paracoccus sp. (in: a-proteobacteria)]|nr:hypothetical protein [Paracoccus sp. (in: a-proteobacteria)]